MKLLKFIYHWLKLGVEYRQEMERIERRYGCECGSDCGQCGIGTGMMSRPRATAKKTLKAGREELWREYWGNLPRK